MSVHSGVGAGCCDCGDEEAWKVGKQGNCGVHSHNKKKGKGKERALEEEEDGEEALREECKRKVEELVRVLLRWCVEQFEKSPRDLIAPKRIEDFTTTIKKGQTRTQIPQPQPQVSTTTRTTVASQSESNAPRLQPATIPTSSSFLSFPWSTTSSSDPPPTQSQVPGSYPISSPTEEETSSSSGPFSILLWNDEKHSFPQVIDIVSLSIGCSRRSSSLVAQKVDTVGRETILVSSDLEECLRVVKMIGSIELGVEVRDSQELFREELAGEIIKWIKGLMGMRVGGEEGGFREIVAKVWLEENNEGRGGSVFERLARVEERLWKECRKGIQEINVGLLSVSYEIKQRLSKSLFHFLE